jgi:hypothetical protein
VWGFGQRRSGVNSAVDIANMMHWVFHRVTDASGSGWRWQCKDEAGRLVAAATQVYAAYPDCLADAMKEGYLSDVKTCCGNLEYL